MQLRYQGGTLVLDNPPDRVALPDCFHWVKGKPRCPGHFYAQLAPWMERERVANRVPRWRRLNLDLRDPRRPHDYQREALAAWFNHDSRGSVVLPTGSGKTFVAVRAIAHHDRSTLVVVPTIDLLHQWYAVLSDAFPAQPIGVFYGGEKRIEEITISTYHSANRLIDGAGDRFHLLIFDEVHHLPGPTWHETALMAVAPCRLGLTATYPDIEETGPLFRQADARPSLESLLGPMVYARDMDDLSGKQLAEYRTERLRIDLTPTERAAYDRAYARYTGYARDTRLRESHGAGWWNEYTRRSAYDPRAREAKVAERELRRIVARAENKIETLASLLRIHHNESILVFTEQNDLVYRISRRFLLPAITHQTRAAERKQILERFRSGAYRTVVTSRVLNEGVDVPEAKVAVILGGSSSTREYIQRLGRILRKRANRTALLYEVIARNTIEVGVSQRRRRSVSYNTRGE